MVDILAVGAHPDDVEMSCGGTIARSVACGHRVVLLDLTRGEMGTRGTPEERAVEAQNAALTLGVAKREGLDLGDTRLFVNEVNRDAVVRVIRRCRPAVVLAPLPSDAHPDHAAAGQLVKDACYLAGVQQVAPDLPPHRPPVLLHYFLHEVLEPNLIMDISGHHDTKVAAIRCFASQLHDPGRQEPQTAISAPGFLEGLNARDRYWGHRIKRSHAEPFFTHRPPAVNDLAHLLEGNA